MAGDEHDEELRARFAKLRREDEARAGELDALLRRAKPKPRRMRLSVWAAAGLAVILVGLLMLDDREDRRPASLEVSITEWKSPTDFLLNTPGQEVLTTVPKIGEWLVTPGAESKPQDPRDPRKGVSRRNSIPNVFLARWGHRPRGLKPNSVEALTARLKPCPSQNRFVRSVRIIEEHLS